MSSLLLSNELYYHTATPIGHLKSTYLVRDGATHELGFFYTPPVGYLPPRRVLGNFDSVDIFIKRIMFLELSNTIEVVEKIQFIVRWKLTKISF